MKSFFDKINDNPVYKWSVFTGGALLIFLLGVLATTIIQRRAEAVFVYTPQVQIDQFEPRNEEWGKNYPREYQSYMKTLDTTFQSKYNGNATVDMLEIDPRLVVL